MKNMTHKLLSAAIGIASFWSLPLLTGCEVEHSHHDYAVAVPSSDTYVYQPGYYYDNEYYDPAGHFHHRAYYYYDGHHWESRDAVPSGYRAQERHWVHEHHDRDWDHDRD
jgi:hypothetical protein